jgi:hypothetical protein
MAQKEDSKNVQIPNEAHKRLKLMASMEGKTMGNKFAELVNAAWDGFGVDAEKFLARVEKGRGG